MATLVSPGVSVSVIDESAYASAGNGTVPAIFIVTRSNKLAPDGTIAEYTKSKYAGLPLTITSQRELVQLYGEPEFTIVDGTPVHGHELNEYGLLAAYYYLGVANRAIVTRADLNVEEMEPLDVAPTGDPVNGTYWFDTANTSFGIFEGNGTAWIAKSVTLFDGTPTGGSDGDYALDISADLKEFYKNESGTWNKLTTADIAGTVNIAPHYNFPTPTSGDVWFKTTSPNSGFNPIIKKYSSSTGSFAQQIIGPNQPDQLVAYIDDAAAATAFGTSLDGNDLYIKIADPSEANFEVRRYDGSSFAANVQEVKATAPVGAIVDGTLWYDAGTTADVYRKTASGWEPVGAGNITVDTIEPAGPTTGDVWVDTNDLANYPSLNVYDGSAFVAFDNADQTTPTGVLFADLTATPQDSSGAGGVATAMDSEAPDPAFFPEGMLLFNTAVSSGNVKKWNDAEGFFQSESGNRDSGPKAGSMYAFDKAQRRVVAKRLQAVLTSGEELREETLNFNLIATPGYPECIDEMLTLNIDRKETAFIIADTPMKLGTNTAEVNAWALGTNAGTNGEDGLTTRNASIGLYYPSALSTDLSGNDVAVPGSHAVLRAYAYNDEVAYPWFAPAGLTRGQASGVSNFGVVTAENEFKNVALNNGQRDALYTKNINPLVNFPGTGLYLWGQKTLHPFASALDRVNVARLLAFLRERFDVVARPFIFEPNDKITRDRVLLVFNAFMEDMVAKRAVFDFLVVCDETNNTNARIDRNELYIDIAIEPVKAAEFIYIPIRVVNTGAIAGANA
ncbi:hypothetical protein N9V27_00120 [bacterium]|nr:hypothetical protein [bacterium]